jgi:hypothetical protein
VQWQAPAHNYPSLRRQSAESRRYRSVEAAGGTDKPQNGEAHLSGDRFHGPRLVIALRSATRRHPATPTLSLTISGGWAPEGGRSGRRKGAGTGTRRAHRPLTKSLTTTPVPCQCYRTGSSGMGRSAPRSFRSRRVKPEGKNIHDCIDLAARTVNWTPGGSNTLADERNMVGCGGIATRSLYTHMDTG